MSSENLTKDKQKSTVVSFQTYQKMLLEGEKEGLYTLAKPGDADYEAALRDQSMTVIFRKHKT